MLSGCFASPIRHLPHLKTRSDAVNKDLISSAPDEVLTLDQAIALALRENHSVRDAELEAGKTGDIVAATRTHRLPSMNVYALATEQFFKPEGIGNIFPGVGPFFPSAFHVDRTLHSPASFFSRSRSNIVSV